MGGDYRNALRLSVILSARLYVTFCVRAATYVSNDGLPYKNVVLIEMMCNDLDLGQHLKDQGHKRYLNLKSTHA